MESLTYRIPGLVVSEHTLTVPLDHAHPQDGRTIEVFARELAAVDGTDRPHLIYLQGGPGFESPRPDGAPRGPGWVDRLLRDYRVVLLDQRGTGRSTPVGPATLAHLPAAELAAYLTHFRADAIVADAERLREALEIERWTALGQSFGGFCTLRYLSVAPAGLSGAIFTGGLPPLRAHVDEVYARTYANAIARSRAYYARYPADRARVRKLRELLDGGAITLPDGDPLTWRRMRQHGNRLGMSNGAEHLHALLELPFDSPAFRNDAQTGLDTGRNPIYAVLHESCYADGGVTNWSAQRMLPPAYETEPELLTAEHIFEWMFTDQAQLRWLADAAQLLAAHRWPTLYDPVALAANEVPAVAAIYVDDLYVDRGFSEQTAARVRGLRPWITNAFEHGALRTHSTVLLDRLLDLLHDRV
jgi:pimeloyl-ACP methyl ester carboxylesterase